MLKTSCVISIDDVCKQRLRVILRYISAFKKPGEFSPAHRKQVFYARKSLVCAVSDIPSLLTRSNVLSSTIYSSISLLRFKEIVYVKSLQVFIYTPAFNIEKEMEAVK